MYDNLEKFNKVFLNESFIRKQVVTMNKSFFRVEIEIF